MYELVRVSDRCFYIESPAKIGLVVMGDKDAFLIDSGNDRDAGKKIKKHLDQNGWTLRAILNTHSHADHIGGNQYLQNQTGCRIYAPGIERDFTEHPILEPSFLYGGNPPDELRHKFLLAQGCEALPLTGACLPEGLEMIPLPGHSFDMVGFRTDEDIVFLADCLSGTETLEKYGIVFLTDPGAYLKTLKTVKEMKARLFIPSHAAPTDDVASLAESNIRCVLQIADTIVGFLKEPMTFENLLRSLFERYGLRMTFEQHALIGSTVRSYLAWLKREGRIGALIDDNTLLWRQV
ncbi:MAG: MBL fold metallo-hydrolase [Clostridia bacterium]|nr:MBL fold metallo-hydrolase [Clostridia bacterium]